MSPWQTPDVAAPDAAGVVQVKVQGTLLDYPQGKSAMVWYGAGPSMAAVARQGLAAADRALGTGTILLWRCVAVPEPMAHFQTLYARFADRFGAAPIANKTSLDRDTP